MFFSSFENSNFKMLNWRFFMYKKSHIFYISSLNKPKLNIKENKTTLKLSTNFKIGKKKSREQKWKQLNKQTTNIYIKKREIQDSKKKQGKTQTPHQNNAEENINKHSKKPIITINLDFCPSWTTTNSCTKWKSISTLRRCKKHTKI